MAQLNRCELFAGLVLYESSVEMAQGRLQKRTRNMNSSANDEELLLALNERHEVTSGSGGEQGQHTKLSPPKHRVGDGDGSNNHSKDGSPTSPHGGERICVRGDSDVVGESQVYSIPPAKVLVVGKYVPLPAEGAGDSNPAANSLPSKRGLAPIAPAKPPPYEAPLFGARQRTPSASRLGSASDRGSNTGKPFPAPRQEVSPEAIEAHVAKAKASSHSLHRMCSATGTLTIAPGEMRTYQMVENVYRYPISVGTVFFPIAYSAKPSAKEKTDPRGLPEEINMELHGPYVMPTYALQVKANNMNKIALFKIGAGAVAFKVVINAFETAGLLYTHCDTDCNVLWAKRVDKAFLMQMNPYQKVNHFPGSWGIGRKDNLHRNISKMRRLFGAQEFDVAPMTFLIPAEYDDLQLDAKSHGNRTYIVKPVASSCGKGIFLSCGLPSLPRQPNKSLLVQHYVSNPMLIEKRKFDLRMYCVVTGVDPLRIFLFDEGLVRFAAEKFLGADVDLENSYMHLTNYSVNKTAALKKGAADDEDEDEPVDIKWTLSDMQHHLKEVYGEERGKDKWNEIHRQCKDVVIRTILSIEASIVEECRASCRDPTGRGCFELFGLDLMVDDSLKVKIIEVNIMPSLATGTNLDKAVKSRMLAHMLTLVGVIPYTRRADFNITKDVRGPPPTPKVLYSFTNSTGTGKKHSVARAAKKPKRSPSTSGMSGDRSPSTPTDDMLLGSEGKAQQPPANSGETAPGPAVDCATGMVIVEKDGVTTYTNAPLRFDISELSLAERAMLVECDEEVNRAGGFERIYPSAGTVRRYLPLFSDGVQRNNFLLASWERMKTLKQV